MNISEVINVGVVEVVTNIYLQMLIGIILLDIFTGIMKSAIQGKLSSRIGLSGLLKHTLIMVTNIVVVMFAPMFDLDVVATSLVIFYIIQYGISLTENWIDMGLPVPNFVRNMLIEKEKELGGKYEETDIR